MASACIKYGGWDHTNKSLTPIKLEELPARPHNPGLSWVMDSLAAAAEAGRLDAKNYVDQLLSNREDVRAFRLVLREAGGDRWLNERHHHALRKLGNAELDVTTYVGIVGLFDLAD